MYRDHRVGILLALPASLQAIECALFQLPDWVDRIVIIVNSDDLSRQYLGQSGAAEFPNLEWVHEPRGGLGAAYLAGLAQMCLGDPPDIVVIAPVSEDLPQCLTRLLDPLIADQTDLAVAASSQRPNRFAIRLNVLESLGMSELGNGWDAQLRQRAAQHRLQVVETTISDTLSRRSQTLHTYVDRLRSSVTRFVRCRIERETDRRLLVFSRLPTPGTTKTRLIPQLGAQGAADLQSEMTTHTLRIADAAMNSPSEVEVRFTGGTRQQMSAAFGRQFCYEDQGTGELGERMCRALASALQDGARYVVCIGSDCPGITPEILRAAFHSLKTHDVVLGPATDGGYYLIGMRELLPGLFRGIRWGSANVLAQTQARLEFNAHSFHLLPTLADVDEAADLPVWQEAKLLESQQSSELVGKMAISVIIPTLNAAATIAAAIRSALQNPMAEIIVCDGGSTDETREIARANGAKVIQAGQGRGRQMNAGAAAAHGDILLFLHADTRLPFGYPRFVQNAIRDPVNSAGAFRLAFDENGTALRMIEWGTAIRATLGQMPYGDQALFLRRETFEQLGGFPTIPVMEDYALVSKLQQLGRIVISPQAAITSADKYRRQGALQTVWRHQKTIIAWHLDQANASE